MKNATANGRKNQVVRLPEHFDDSALKRASRINTFFSKVASSFAKLAGQPLGFICAVLLVVIWAVTGPMFHFSDTWQLVINTGTTIITFLMVFLIQNSQNRESTAMQLKLDEIIRSQIGAANKMLDVEELSFDDLENLLRSYQRVARQARIDEEKRGTVQTDPVDLEKNVI
jgi:low affinity Fe/Cu permease